MSKLLFAVLLLLALISVNAVSYDLDVSDVENQEVQPFQTLADIDPSGPDAAFAELSSNSDSDADADAEGEGEGEADVEGEADAETETDAESEAEVDADSAADASADAELAMIESSSQWPPFRGNNQPINRHKRNGVANIECLDGDCARAVKSRRVKVGSNPTALPKKPSKLDLALSATREEIMVHAKELHAEKAWAKKVGGLITEYQQKLNQVHSNIDKLRGQTKKLLKKKKQIQNIQVQNKLKAKLTVAQSDLNRLQKQMNHIHGKENEFADTERQLKNTMGQLKNSLLKLKGQSAKKAAYEGIV